MLRCLPVHRLAAVLPLLAVLVGCGEEDADSAAFTCDREPPLSYDNFGEGFMAKHCAGCHSSLQPEDLREGAPASVNLDTYADVLAWAERIEIRAVPDGADMPPGGGPSAEERALLAEWLHCQVFSDAAALPAE